MCVRMTIRVLALLLAEGEEQRVELLDDPVYQSLAVDIVHLGG